MAKYISPVDVAEYLANCSKEEFVETFALFDKYRKGTISSGYNPEKDVKELDVEGICDEIKSTLTSSKRLSSLGVLFINKDLYENYDINMIITDIKMSCTLMAKKADEYLDNPEISRPTSYSSFVNDMFDNLTDYCSNKYGTVLDGEDKVLVVDRKEDGSKDILLSVKINEKVMDKLDELFNIRGYEVETGSYEYDM